LQLGNLQIAASHLPADPQPSRRNQIRSENAHLQAHLKAQFLRAAEVAVVNPKRLF